MKNYKFIDLSGYGSSGKTALINVFQEFNSTYWVSEPKFEFQLVRVKHGLLDLENALFHSWSPSRTSTSMYEFIKMVKKIGFNPTSYNIVGRLFSSGSRVNKYFDNKFIEICNKYYNSLIYMEYKAYNLYPFQNMNMLMLFILKILDFLGKRLILNEKNILTITDKDKFYILTHNLLNELFSTIDTHGQIETFTINNAIEPYNSKQALKLFKNIKQIIIDRDPRDLYLSTIQTDQFVGNYHMGFSASDDIENFVLRYKYLRNKVDKEYLKKNQDIILEIHFEDLVLDYGNTLSKIFTFLGEDESIHINKKKYFDPEVSKAGVGMWKNTDKKREVDYIYQHLKEYCKDY